MSNKIIKLAVLGDGACGKTSLIRAKIDHQFIETSKITIGVDVFFIPFPYSLEKQKEEGMFMTMDLGG